MADFAADLAIEVVDQVSGLDVILDADLGACLVVDLQASNLTFSYLAFGLVSRFLESLSLATAEFQLLVLLVYLGFVVQVFAQLEFACLGNLIPFGLGTGVAFQLTCLVQETRLGIKLGMKDHLGTVSLISVGLGTIGLASIEQANLADQSFMVQQGVVLACLEQDSVGFRTNSCLEFKIAVVLCRRIPSPY